MGYRPFGRLNVLRETQGDIPEVLGLENGAVPSIHQLATGQLKLARRYQHLASKRLEQLEKSFERLKSGPRYLTYPAFQVEAQHPELYAQLIEWAKGKPFLIDADSEGGGDVNFSYPHLPFAAPFPRRPHRPAKSKREVELSLLNLYECELYGESRGFSRHAIRTAIAYLGPRSTLTAMVDYILLHLAPLDVKGAPAAFCDGRLQALVEDVDPELSAPPEIPSDPTEGEIVKADAPPPSNREEEPRLVRTCSPPLPPTSDYDYMLDQEVSFKYAQARQDCEIYSQLLQQLANSPLEATYSPGIRQQMQHLEKVSEKWKSALWFNAKEAKYHTEQLCKTRLERTHHLKQAICPKLAAEMKRLREAHVPSKQKEPPKVSFKEKVPIATDTDEEEPPFALDSLFDDELFPSDAPTVGAEAPSVSDATPGSHVKPPEVQVDLTIPATWTGQTPKALLLGFCNAKRAEIRVTFDKVSAVAKAAVIVRTTAASPTTHRFRSSQVPSPAQPKTRAEAENLVATLALFKLNWLSSASVLPPAFQRCFTGWRLEEKLGQDLATHNDLLLRYDFLTATLTPPGDPPNSPSPGLRVDPAREMKLPPSEAKVSEVAKPTPPAYWSQRGRDLKAAFYARTQSQSYRALLAQRRQLPMYAFRGQLLEAVADPGRVILVVGETGCGKTTQVPQFLVEQAAARNEPCRVVCTQPRRLSAISVAQRVSQELGDAGVGAMGSWVGYQIRLASRTSASNLLVFCTLGVLLRRLEEDFEFKGLTHLVIDEIQERSLDSDFLLVLVRRILTQSTHLRVVLMSATVDAHAFSTYFGNCPVLQVPGRTFPVQVHHLEAVLQMTGYVPDSVEAQNPLRASANNSRARALDLSAPADSTLAREDRTINELIVRLLRHGDLPEGAILVFLPGVPEIKLLHGQIAADPVLGDPNRFLVLQAHSGVPPDQQAAIFAGCPAPLRKVVLATNVAETGITVPDVTIVIDTGRMKQIQRDPKLQVSQLVEVDVAQANAKQRTGRAGRVRPGVCFRLFTQERFNRMLPYQTPEMARLPLEELCLRIKQLGLRDIRAFLAQALHPPPQEAVTTSISLLQEVGALDASNELTSLGVHLSRLPVSVHIGKLMIYGVLFRCLDPALTFAAVLSYRSPLSAPIPPTFTTGRCDFLSLYSVYGRWREAMARGMKHGVAFCATGGLSLPILLEIEGMKQQYLNLLVDAGLVTFADGPPTRRLPRDMCSTPPSFDINGTVEAVVKCVLVAGLYPKVLAYNPTEHTLVKPPILIHPAKLDLAVSLSDALSRPQASLPQVLPTFNSIHHPAFSTPAAQAPRQLLPAPNQRYAVYFNLMKGRRNLTAEALSFITPLPILLFARDLVVVHDARLAIADSALYIRCPNRTLSAVMQLRLELSRVLAYLVSAPAPSTGAEIGGREASHARLLSLLVELLASEG
ncbi:hypothetical protein L0F63_007015 [Massospora cicadina]|nr:hypothetical protein L0F63_007015 [Massospora cicadina]